MKIKLIKTISLLVFLCGFLAATNAFAATLTVTKSADTADGICDVDCSLREAVVAANSGDVIVFSPLFNSPQTITLISGQIAINKSLTIAGTGADLLTVSGNNANRIFYISANVVALSGMKLTGGKDSYQGGAIYLTDSTLSLTNMTLNDNKVFFTQQQSPPVEVIGSGGAVYSNNSALTVINSLFNANHGYNSIYSAGNGVVSVVGSIFNGNRGTAIYSASVISVVSSTFTYNGGGIGSGKNLTLDRSIITNSGQGVAAGGNATITKTTINQNSVFGNGGGVANSGSMSISDSTISNNKADGAGGGIINSGQLTVTNSTISRNTSEGAFVIGIGPGGGIYNTATGSLTLTNSTITKNNAYSVTTGVGGGLNNASSGTVILRNTIIAGNSAANSAQDVGGSITSQGYNLIGNSTGSSGWTSSDLLNRDPLLAPLGNNGGLTFTHALMLGSPAINAGNNELAVDPATNTNLQYDQRGIGYLRVYGGAGNGIVDIGAYELSLADSPVTLSGKVSTAIGRGISNARVTITETNARSEYYARTNPFGYYRFDNLLPGKTYQVTVVSKRYQFSSPQIVTIDRNRDDLNFVASSTRY